MEKHPTGKFSSLNELFESQGFHGTYHTEEISTGEPVGAEKLDELFSGPNGEYEYHEIDWGKPVGNEIW